MMAMMNECDHNLLVWIDLEMSGLDLQLHTIVEIAVAITDFQLKNYIEGWFVSMHRLLHFVVDTLRSGYCDSS